MVFVTLVLYNNAASNVSPPPCLSLRKVYCLCGVWLIVVTAELAMKIIKKISIPRNHHKTTSHMVVACQYCAHLHHGGLKSAKISYSHIHVWRSCANSHILSLPIFLHCQFGTQPPNLISSNTSSHTVLTTVH